MTQLDSIDATIVRSLLEDARRPYSDIAEEVDLSPPAVRDRIDRLQEIGVIQGFTIDLDRSTLGGGIPVFVELALEPDAVDDVHDDIVSVPSVEHVFTAAEPRIFLQARVPKGNVREFLEDTIDLTGVRDVEVTMLTNVEWTPGLGRAGFDLDCAECGNTVTEEGESTRIGGDLYHFCCASCRSRFETRHAEISEGA